MDLKAVSPSPTSGTGSAVAMSVILPTDTYETIRTVIQHLRRQTVRDRLEIVIVAPRSTWLGLVESELEGFAAVRVVPVESIPPLGAARAAGVRAARAPLVYIGETHSYAHPQCAEILIRELDGPWTSVVPGFGNINPVGILSWSLFLLDYGLYLSTFPPRETMTAPIHNVAYKRAALLELGSELDRELAHGDQLLVSFHARGYRTFFQPAARVDHLNVSRLTAWVSDRFQCGLLIGGRRAERWSVLRRLVYFVGAPLIPLVLFRRVSKGARDARRQGAPFGTTAALILATVVATVGEMIGYAANTSLDADARLTEIELHRLPYISPRSWADPDVLSRPLGMVNP